MFDYKPVQYRNDPPIDESRCRAQVQGRGRWSLFFHQCFRRPIDDRYCKQHRAKAGVASASSKVK
jgi:hypothetical protein